MWCWEADRGCLWAKADEMASQAATQRLLHGTEKRTKPQDAQQAAADEGPMATALRAVEQRAHPTGLLELVGEAALRAAPMDGEAHQAAARPT